MPIDPYSPPPPGGTRDKAQKKARDAPIEEASRQYARRQVERVINASVSPPAEPEAPPPDYRPLSAQAARQIRTVVESSAGTLLFQADGTFAGDLETARFQLRANVQSELGVFYSSEPLPIEQRMSYLERGEPVPEVPEPPDVEQVVAERLSRLIAISAEDLKADPRILEKVRVSTGRPIRTADDNELPELEPLPTLTCPDCGSTDVKVNSLNRPPSGDCLTEGCRRHFGLKREEDQHGRTWFVVSKPAPSRGVEGHVGVGGSAASRIF